MRSSLANRATLDQLAHALMEQESLEGDALDDLLLNVTQTGPADATPAGAGAGKAAGSRQGNTERAAVIGLGSVTAAFSRRDKKQNLAPFQRRISLTYTSKPHCRLGDRGGTKEMNRKFRRFVVLGAAAGALAMAAMPGAGAAGPPQLTKPVHATKADLNPQRTYGGPYLAVNPDDHDIIVGGFIEFRARKCGLIRSTDAGQTWKILESTPEIKSQPYCLANNSNIFHAPVQWGRDNALYLATHAWDETTRTQTSIIVAKSTDLGDTWNTVFARDARTTSGDNQENDRPVTGFVVDAKSGQPGHRLRAVPPGVHEQGGAERRAPAGGDVDLPRRRQDLRGASRRHRQRLRGPEGPRAGPHQPHHRDPGPGRHHHGPAGGLAGGQPQRHPELRCLQQRPGPDPRQQGQRLRGLHVRDRQRLRCAPGDHGVQVHRQGQDVDQRDGGAVQLRAGPERPQRLDAGRRPQRHPPHGLGVAPPGRR